MARAVFWFLTRALVVGGLTLGDAAAEPALSGGADIRALHELVQKAQERLTPEEQQAWARALELRRSAEGETARVGRQP